MTAGPSYPHPIPRPPAEGCSCYVEHRETLQTIPNYDGHNGARPDPVLIDPWADIDTCGMLDNANATLMLALNWQWQARSHDPFSAKFSDPDNSPMVGGGPPYGAPPTVNVPNARLVAVYAEGMTPTNGDDAIAIDTRLGLGDDWLALPNSTSGLSVEGGSIFVALNIFPAGQLFSVWVAQNTADDLDIILRADLYTVCACECVL